MLTVSEKFSLFFFLSRIFFYPEICYECLFSELRVPFLTLQFPSPREAGALSVMNRLQVHVVEYVRYLN